MSFETSITGNAFSIGSHLNNIELSNFCSVSKKFNNSLTDAFWQSLIPEGIPPFDPVRDIPVKQFILKHTIASEDELLERIKQYESLIINPKVNFNLECSFIKKRSDNSYEIDEPRVTIQKGINSYYSNKRNKSEFPTKNIDFIFRRNFSPNMALDINNKSLNTKFHYFRRTLPELTAYLFYQIKHTRSFLENDVVIDVLPLIEMRCEKNVDTINKHFESKEFFISYVNKFISEKLTFFDALEAKHDETIVKNREQLSFLNLFVTKTLMNVCKQYLHIKYREDRTNSKIFPNQTREAFDEDVQKFRNEKFPKFAEKEKAYKSLLNFQCEKRNFYLQQYFKIISEDENIVREESNDITSKQWYVIAKAY